MLGVRTPRNPVWTDAENQFLRDSYPTMPIKEICARLGRSYVAIQHQAERSGISKIGNPGSAWTESEDELLGDLYGTMPPGRLAEMLGRTETAMTHRAMRLGINNRSRRPERQAREQPKDPTVLTMRWDSIRHDYFAQIDSPMKAYVLGWIASDGNVKTKENTIRLRVNAKDEEALHVVRQELAPLHSISPYLGRRPSGEMSPMVRFEVNSARMKQDLIRLGVTPKKSLTIRYPPIPPHLDNSFILGCFDGDGSLGFYGYDGRDPLPRWQLTSGSLPFIEEVQRRILLHAGVRVGKPCAKRRARREGDDRPYAWDIRKNGRAVVDIDAWLHADVPGLARKRLPADAPIRAKHEASIRRAEKIGHARRLRSEGRTLTEIGAELGITKSLAHQWTQHAA